MKTKKGLPAEASAKAGSGLIFAVVLLFVILGMVITLSSVTVLETKMSQKTKSSVGAFYNSESGVEWALSKIANATGANISDAFPGYAGNRYGCPANFNCDIFLLGEDGKVITLNDTIDKVKAVRSVGFQGTETQRAIEAAVAASGCKSGYIDAGSYCVEQNEHGNATWFAAAAACQSAEGRLCAPDEWYAACVNESSMQDKTNDWEWFSEAGGNNEIGNNTCDNWGAIGQNNNRDYRCCANKI